MIRCYQTLGLQVLAALLLIHSQAWAWDSAAGQGDSASTHAPTPAARPTRGGVRVFILAPPETIRLSPSLASDREDRQPTVDYPSLDVARDSIGAMVLRSVNAIRPAIRLSSGPVCFKYWYAAGSADGWAFHITVTDTSECPTGRLENALLAAGWAPSYGYAADGPDGGVVGLVCKRFLCVADSRWDGGDDSDSTYVPQPGCEVTVTCVPRREEDVPER